MRPGAPVAWGARHLAKAGPSGLGRLWEAGCRGACKLINTAAALAAGDARAGSWCPEGGPRTESALPAPAPGLWAESAGPAPSRQVLGDLEKDVERAREGWGDRGLGSR